MTTDQDIDDLLRQDEEALKAKRARLKAFARAMDDLRRVNEAAREATTALVDEGDLSRNDLVRIFDLNTAEKLAITRRRPQAAGESQDEQHDGQQAA